MPWRPLYPEDEFPTLGFMVADWMEEFLFQTDTDDATPFVCTAEQLDFLTRLYELDPDTGTRARHRAVLSRPRGWGKSPFVAAIACAEALGPVLCDGWDADGQPVGVPWSRKRFADVYVAATTEDQAVANTWSAVLDMLNGAPAVDYYDLEVMGSFVSAPRAKLSFITSSGTATKGRRGVAAIMDQTETWLPHNGGVKLAQVLRNNATKLGGVTIETPNAFTVGEGSVAELSAKTAEDVEKGRAKAELARVLLYDHRGAPTDTDIGDHDSLIAGLRVAYGDSSADPRGCVIHEPPCEPGWVDLERVAVDFWDTSNDPAIMAADFLNQIGAASDAWMTMPEMRAIADPDKVVSETEPVTLGFDGSEGRARGLADSTVLIGYSVTQRHLFKVGIWSQPDGPKGQGWKPPRLEIEQTVADFFEHHNVVGFYADPSAGWASDVKGWESRYSRRLKVKISTAEPIRWPQRIVAMTADVFAQLLSTIRQGPEAITYDATPELTAHFLNARKDPRRNGYVLKKADDNQDYGKIDAAWGAMFAFKAGVDALGKGVTNIRRRRAPRRLY